MTSPEEEAIEGQEEIVEPETGAKGEQTEMTAIAWEIELRETHDKIKAKIIIVEGLLGRLDFALKNRSLKVYLYETDNGVHITMQEKGQLGFLETPAPNPIPEGGSRISVTRFREVLGNSRKRLLAQIAKIESLLSEHEKSLTNPELILTFYRDSNGFGMETEEKAPMGFLPYREEN